MDIVKVHNQISTPLKQFVDIIMRGVHWHPIEEGMLISTVKANGAIYAFKLRTVTVGKKDSDIIKYFKFEVVDKVFCYSWSYPVDIKLAEFQKEVVKFVLQMLKEKRWTNETVIVVIDDFDP